MQSTMKRFSDVCFSFVLLLILSPLLILLSIITLILLGYPVLFRQLRPGLNGKPFHFYKFRTMTNDRDSNGRLLPDELRMTRFGKFLRKTSLDELPSFYNVLRGDMSLVGPRPLLMEYLPLYNEDQSRRHHVRPGITGLAQVSGRNAGEWEKRFELDVWYVDHRSFLLDIKILCKTFLIVFQRKGIQAEGYVTMPKFKGNQKSTW